MARAVRKPSYVSYISQRTQWEGKGYALSEAMTEKEFQLAYQKQKIHNPSNILRNLVKKELVVSKTQARSIHTKIMEYKKTNTKLYNKLIKLFPNYKTQKGIMSSNFYRMHKAARQEAIAGLINEGEVNPAMFDAHPQAVSEAQQAFFDMWDQLGSKELAEITYGY